MEIEICCMVFVPHCDVSQCINRLEVIDLLFLDLYTLLSVGLTPNAKF
jgi:hypothetical protein